MKYVDRYNYLLIALWLKRSELNTERKVGAAEMSSEWIFFPWSGLLRKWLKSSRNLSVGDNLT